MKISQTTLHNATKFYLQYQGQRGTIKQVEKLIKQLPAQNIIEMAIQRGFKL